MARSWPEMTRKHSNEAFYALDGPLETAVFSVLLGLVKEMDKADCEMSCIACAISDEKVNARG